MATYPSGNQPVRLAIIAPTFPDRAGVPGWASFAGQRGVRAGSSRLGLASPYLSRHQCALLQPPDMLTRRAVPAMAVFELVLALLLGGVGLALLAPRLGVPCRCTTSHRHGCRRRGTGNGGSDRISTRRTQGPGSNGADTALQRTWPRGLVV